MSTKTRYMTFYFLSYLRMQSILLLLLIIFTNYSKSKEVTNKFEKSFPYLRLKMEEGFSDQVNQSVDESSDDFVSFLVDNVKELFVSSRNETFDPSGPGLFDTASLLGSFKTSTVTMPRNLVSGHYNLIHNKIYLPYLRVNSDTEIINKFNSSNEENNNIEENNNVEENNMELLNILKNIEWTPKKIKQKSTLTRTCIICNNILYEDCSNPKLKLVATIDCEREDDLCYSQHTPFGIVDRGCYNLNHDPTIFICACNLCNYISISEMPYIFSNKRDWVENVIELSRAKRFRESILKDMECLRCEGNVTAKRENDFDDADCLDGNITLLPKQICKADEVCGVKAIRSQGYIWRGCISEPLYNYWWTFCKDDFCNDDILVSIYDNNI